MLNIREAQERHRKVKIWEGMPVGPSICPCSKLKKKRSKGRIYQLTKLSLSPPSLFLLPSPPLPLHYLTLASLSKQKTKITRKEPLINMNFQ